VAAVIAPSTTLLSVHDLRVYYGAAAALHGVSFDVRPGEVVTIIGGNGAGKSTTLKTLSGMSELAKTVEGEITFNGRRIDRLAAHRIVGLGISHVPEGRRVFPQSSVEENLLLGAFTRRRNHAEIDAGIEQAYARFPRLAERRSQLAGLLSGGEQQMLAIARGLMSRPSLLLLDEPSLGLAPLLAMEVFAAVRALADDGMTILLVEQLAKQALAISDRAYVLEQGTVTLEGPAASVAADPAVRAAYLGA